jgi:hypothetical protein
MKKIISFSILFFLHTISCVAQYNNFWYFGTNSGLNFNTNPPTVLTNGSSPSYDYTSTMSDLSGNLLFHTDGITVWDKNNNVMPNGTGLIGNFTAGACALIVPIPCSTTKYVIFHCTEFVNPGSLSYSVVDMSLNGGLGDVIVSQKNISLGTGWTEKLCAYFDSVNGSYWVLTHKYMSADFVAFKVDATTIATTSVVSTVGSVLNCGTIGGAHDAMGQLTISQNGAMVANALTCQDKFELFQFNSTTGVLSNSITIPGTASSAWGTAFSPNNQKLYLTNIFNSGIYQYDLSTYNQSAIVNSSFAVNTPSLAGYNFGYIELGPDNKIYVPRPNTGFISVIGSPDLAGVACSFSYTGQSIGAASAKWGLSRAAYNIQSIAIPTITVAISPSVICTGQQVTITASGASTYSWSNGGNGSVHVITPSITSTYSVMGTSVGHCSATTTFSVHVDDCTGIKQQNNSLSSIHVFPNPNTGKFVVNVESDGNLIIQNALGEIIQSISLSKGVNTIDISTQANGVYFLLLRDTNGKNATCRLIKY